MPKQQSDFFGPVFLVENAFPPFSYTEGLLFLEIKISNFFHFHCVAEASSFSLNCNLTLASQQIFVQDPIKAQILSVFYRNYNYYTKCVVIWCSAPFKTNRKVEFCNFFSIFEKIGLFWTRHFKSQLSMIHQFSKSPWQRLKAYTQNRQILHISSCSTLLQILTQILHFPTTFSCIFCFEYSLKCFKIKVLILHSLCYSNCDVKMIPPPI